MNTELTTSSFYLSLVEFLLLAKHQIADTGTDFGLTPVQIITLLLIKEDQPRPMKTISCLYHCDASNTTGIIDGLEQKGLVSRENDPKDRRVKIICLQPEGKRLQGQISTQLAKKNSLLFAPLSDTEASQFAQIITKLGR